jgi:uncharacterized sulfatase
MPQKSSPNIVLIVLDTHRLDRLNTYGYHRNTSPNIEAFARQATVFENGVSTAQWTIPSHASMFTGEYPATHQTLQAHHTLDSRFITLTQLLKMKGYKTTGFCNNPLVGVLDNGLKRGFDTFYNYSGVVPSVPRSSSHIPEPLNRIWEWYTQQLRKLSYPIQNAFAHSDLLFRLSLHPKIVPLWTTLANFKGNTVNSLRDARTFLADAYRANSTKPHFTFINLMETHFPYSPPETFIDRFAPYFKEEREARDFIRRYNAEIFRWLAPAEKPFKEIEAAILNDMYDAEVSYQDHLLGDLLEFLTQKEVADNTLTIIVGDHGEGLGEHNSIGHAFVAYQELIHVPLIIKFPDQAAVEQRPTEAVSTRRIFHTILDLANIQIFETQHRPTIDVKSLNLLRTVQGKDPEQELVFTEAYAPNTFLSMMERHVPHLIEPFHCRCNRRAVFQGQKKLVRIDGVQDELFDLAADPLELHDLSDHQPDLAAKLSGKLDAFMSQALARRPDTWQANRTLNLEEDENLLKQLRALGYIE